MVERKVGHGALAVMADRNVDHGCRVPVKRARVPAQHGADKRIPSRRDAATGTTRLRADHHIGVYGFTAQRLAHREGKLAIQHLVGCGPYQGGHVYQCTRLDPDSYFAAHGQRCTGARTGTIVKEVVLEIEARLWDDTGHRTF